MQVDGSSWQSHVMSYVSFDEGLALFAGLNVIRESVPVLTEYS